MDFEWDEKKACSNLAKHKLDFADAIRIFLDPFKIEIIDDRQDYQEKRLKIIGQVDGLTLVVVYTKRGKKFRLISARLANKKEKKTYENNKTSS